MTGRGLNELLYKQCEIIDELTALLKATPDQIPVRVQSLLEENKKLKKQIKKDSGVSLKTTAQELLDQAQTFGEAKIIVGQFPSASVDVVRSQIDWLRKKAPSAVIVLASATEDSKVLLFAAVTDDLIAKGIKAGDIVKQIAPIVGGGGGGRPQMAQAGGKDISKIGDAMKAASEFIEAKLKG
jgi:alanyl-tRNA synthetase